MRNKNRAVLTILWLSVIMVVIALCVGCQSGAQNPPPAKPDDSAKKPVVIVSKTPDKSPTPQQSDEPEPIINSTFKRRSERDPFIPVVKKEEPVQPGTPTAAPPVSPTPGTGSTPKPGATETPKKPAGIVEVKPEQIGVSVVGIMKVDGGYKAILNSKDGSNIVAVGEKVGDWVVTGIDTQAVFLRNKGYKVKLSIPKDNLGKGGTPPAGGKVPKGQPRPAPKR